MDNRIFLDDISVNQQSVKEFHYSTDYDESIDWKNFSNLETTLDYEVLTNKGNDRDFLILLEFHVKDSENECYVVVAGNYEVKATVKEKSVQDVLHHAGLSSLISFLRSSLLSITTLTSTSPFILPMVSLPSLHKKFNEKMEKESLNTDS